MENIRLENIANSCGNIKKTMQKRINNFLKFYDITSLHAHYLLFLKSNDGLTMKKINYSLCVDKAHTARVVKTLQERNFVYRTENQRNYRIYLTKEGMEMANHIEKNMITLKNRIMNNINNEQLDVAITILKQIEENLKGK